MISSTSPFEDPIFIYSADLDGDGDMDVLAASSNDNKISCFENDGSGSFGAQRVISISAEGVRSVYSCDLDGDGDMDVLSAPYYDDKITWFENDGSGSFGDQHVITTSTELPISVYASDLDGDGDMDVLSASYHEIAWYENLMGCTDVNENDAKLEKFSLYQNYPNPFNPETTIQFALQKKSHVTLKVYDILGKQVSMIVNRQMSAGSHKVQFNAKGLASGIYFYQIQMGAYNEMKKMILSR